MRRSRSASPSPSSTTRRRCRCRHLHHSRRVRRCSSPPPSTPLPSSSSPPACRHALKAVSRLSLKPLSRKPPARPPARDLGFPGPELDSPDRVGGGDSFASGLLCGLLELGDVGAAVEYGAAHGALAMTTPGDTSTARLAEVRRLVERGGARVQR